MLLLLKDWREYFREKLFPVSTSLVELRRFYHNYSEKKFISTKLFALSLYKYQALLVIFLTSERLLVERVNSFRNIFLASYTSGPHSESEINLATKNPRYIYANRKCEK